MIKTSTIVAAIVNVLLLSLVTDCYCLEYTEFLSQGTSIDLAVTPNDDIYIGFNTGEDSQFRFIFMDSSGTIETDTTFFIEDSTARMIHFPHEIYESEPLVWFRSDLHDTGLITHINRWGQIIDTVNLEMPPSVESWNYIFDLDGEYKVFDCYPSTPGYRQLFGRYNYDGTLIDTTMIPPPSSLYTTHFGLLWAFYSENHQQMFGLYAWDYWESRYRCRLHLRKFNPDGSIADSVTEAAQFYDIVPFFTETPDSGFATLHSILDGDTITSYRLTKYSRDLEEQWSREISFGYCCFPSTIVCSATGFFYVVYEDTDMENDPCFLAQLNEDGEIIQTRLLFNEVGLYHRRVLLFQTPNDQIFVLGRNTYWDTTMSCIFIASLNTDDLSVEAVREVSLESQMINEDSGLITITPNPFNSSCRIETAKDAQIEIFDIKGNLVQKLGNTDVFTPTKDMPSGVYLVQARTKEETVTKKIHFLK